MDDVYGSMLLEIADRKGQTLQPPSAQYTHGHTHTWMQADLYCHVIC